jgi:hypothetical protein
MKLAFTWQAYGFWAISSARRGADRDTPIASHSHATGQIFSGASQ